MNLLLAVAADSSPLRHLLADSWPVLIPAALGLAAVYLLLPRPRPFPAWWGGLLGGLALVVAGWWWVWFPRLSAEAVLFYSFAGLAVFSGGRMITYREPVYAALAFALMILSTCGLFLLLAAPFLTAAVIIVYAGAIVVTFLFVLMLAQQRGYSSADLRTQEPLLVCLAGFLLLGGLGVVLGRTYRPVGLPEAQAQQLRELVAQAGRACQARDLPALRQVLGEQREFFKQFHQLLEQPALRDCLPADEVRELSDALDYADAAWAGREEHPEFGQAVENVKKHLQTVYQRGQWLLRQLQLPGTLLPPVETPVSPFATGPLSPEPFPQPGRLPAENVASLGRLLFTEYLLPLEVAGLLLLVATIGAAVIAARRREDLQ
jgi:NADH-quinone oxidoreductase subunit J